MHKYGFNHGSCQCCTALLQVSGPLPGPDQRLQSRQSSSRSELLTHSPPGVFSAADRVVNNNAASSFVLLAGSCRLSRSFVPCPLPPIHTFNACVPGLLNVALCICIVLFIRGSHSTLHRAWLHWHIIIIPILQVKWIREVKKFAQGLKWVSVATSGMESRNWHPASCFNQLTTMQPGSRFFLFIYQNCTLIIVRFTDAHKPVQ